ncbi:4-phosphoerythronate dehydrogenase [Acinetobacter larvae]|uniref:Erythronate-4-phosphate dehydrogenase n=1 Tax=Acinetobacter larvae TaxID=1789224 RepID=A0A1B2M4A8_9GAMM|nr:4-phosphoerythronate dehydrogenase [Acinetobacter larvae]AOA59992.1 erythronate-4-phosphate dehydrogenase [Acinetobacter larvae]
MNIIADENLALTDYFFADLGTVQQHAGRQLQAAQLKDAELLLVRSVTAVNQALLQGSAIKFVGSATIGTDHLDIDYLEQQQITWANAAGCNAQAVAEYVIAAILAVQPQQLYRGQQFCLGIVGLGNVGTRLARVAERLGWRVIAYDPFCQSTQTQQVSWQDVLAQSDAISIHVPLTHDGEHPTYHLFDQKALAQMPAHSMLINSARGAVVEEQALIENIMATGRAVVLDVFEHEPKISQQLLSLLSLATPHIAGYSLEGKARGTQMIYEAYCRSVALPTDKTFRSQLTTAESLYQNESLQDFLAQHLTQIYAIREDDQKLRACLRHGQIEPAAFDDLRKHYPLRREWSAHGLPCFAE